jgi:hypothetical protein
MAIVIKNNFNSLKEDFKKDTGKKAEDNLELYTHYVSARFADMIYQMNVHILQKISNLSQEIAFDLKQK